MSSQNTPDWEPPFVEVEINPETPPSSGSQKSAQPDLERAASQLKEWFNRLPIAARAVVAIFAVMVAFSLLNTVLQVVASLISTAILAAILYLLYRAFMAPRPPQ